MGLRNVVLRIFAGETQTEREERAQRSAETHSKAATTRGKIDALVNQTRAQNERIRQNLP